MSKIDKCDIEFQQKKRSEAYFVSKNCNFKQWTQIQLKIFLV